MTKKPAPNPVADAILRVGGPTRASIICEVSNMTIYSWRKLGRVALAAPAVRLAKASGIAIEALVGLAPYVPTPGGERRGRDSNPRLVEHASALAPARSVQAVD